MDRPDAARIGAVAALPMKIRASMSRMRRRDFIIAVGGSVAAWAWPLVARAQQAERVRRIAVLNGTASTGQNPAAYDAFLRRLGELGWTDGRNVRIEVRWANSNPELMRSYGTELARNSPDVFLVVSNPALGFAAIGGQYADRLRTGRRSRPRQAARERRRGDRVKAQAPARSADDARQHARARRAAAYRIVPSVPFAVITRS